MEGDVPEGPRLARGPAEVGSGFLTNSGLTQTLALVLHRPSQGCLWDKQGSPWSPYRAHTEKPRCPPVAARGPASPVPGPAVGTHGYSHDRMGSLPVSSLSEDAQRQTT